MKISNLVRHNRKRLNAVILFRASVTNIRCINYNYNDTRETNHLIHGEVTKLGSVK